MYKQFAQSCRLRRFFAAKNNNSLLVQPKQYFSLFNFFKSKGWESPAKIEQIYSKTAGNKFSGINKPTAGAQVEGELPSGSSPLQLYSLATPNGQKVAILLEELGLDYDAHVINIMEGAQFTSGYVKVNPNSKIPCMIDRQGRKGDGQSVRLFESGSMLLYLAEKEGKFIPKDLHERAECMNWLFWQMGNEGPLFGQFGHFYKYAPRDQIAAIDYGVSRYGMEVQRMLSVLELRLQETKYLAGDDYTIADMAVYPWVVCLTKGYDAYDFLSVSKYEAVDKWCKEIASRDPVSRGMRCCHFNGIAKPWLVPK